MAKNKPVIGFVGQGFVGKNYADDFEERGYQTIRYALEEPYKGNKSKIQDADIVLICVPTPTVPNTIDIVRFDSSIVDEAVGLVGPGKIAVIKSTLLPGTTAAIQKKYPDRIVLCSPEFLSIATAREDARHPFSNIVGVPEGSGTYHKAADAVHAVLPEAPFVMTCKSIEAELIKYAHNGSGYTQVIFFNLMYDLAEKLGGTWDVIRKAIEADPMVCNRYSNPVHKGGRGAGGFCFIKDFAALHELYRKTIPEDVHGIKALRSFECKNVDLLMKTNKDFDLLRGVYGEGPEKICTPLEIAEGNGKAKMPKRS